VRGVREAVGAVTAPFSWRLIRDIQDAASTKERERAMFARLRRHLDDIDRWPGLYVPPDDIPLGPHRPPCSCATPAETLPDGKCSRCYGAVIA
jgi:hypothetical protein